MRIPRDRLIRPDARLPDGSWLLRALRYHLGVQHPQHKAAVLRLRHFMRGQIQRSTKKFEPHLHFILDLEGAKYPTRFNR